MSKTIIISVFLGAALAVGLIIYQSIYKGFTPFISNNSIIGYINPTVTMIPTASPTPTLTPTPTIVKKDLVLIDVPFTVQAPFGEWQDPKQQDACEEASVLMAMAWVKGQATLSAAAVKQELLAIADYQAEKFGEYRDTSVQDTAKRIIEGYYNYTNYEIKQVNTAEDIVDELDRNNVVILPLNGQILGNMSFTQPGPERHMLVVKGYDRTTEQFITNETGIRQGNNWRYSRDIIFNAIRDYESGYHVPFTETRRLMIVIKK